MNGDSFIPYLIDHISNILVTINSVVIDPQKVIKICSVMT